MNKPTPMMAQYQKIKSQYPDCFLFYRLGDFYELFADDALEAAKILNITLTKRGKNENAIPMCGVPYHAAEGYIAKLTRAGRKVAICEQISEPSKQGIVERGVIRVVTPGTTLDDKILEKKSNNFIAAISRRNEEFGVAFADITTGVFELCEVKNAQQLEEILLRVRPTECIGAAELLAELKLVLNRMEIHSFPFESYKESNNLLKEHFGVQSLDGFGIENMSIGIKSAGLLLHYLQETQKTNMQHLRSIKPYHWDEFMHLDGATINNLELLKNMRDATREGSLISVLDETLTAMGGRLLSSWLIHPLLEPVTIQKRLDAVAELQQNSSFLNEVQNQLKDILDIERLLGRLSLGSGNGRDLLALKQSLLFIPQIKNLLAGCQSEYLQQIARELTNCDDLVELITRAISEEAPLSLREGNIIADGFNEELDKLRDIMKSGKSFILELQEKEIARTGINTLKVRFNRVFGYYIEISKGSAHLAPEDYMRKQTLVNAERFITPELKEYEETVLGAEEKIVQIEYDLFCQVRNKVLSHIEVLQKNASLLAQLDVLQNFAFVALKHKYCKPSLSNEAQISIKNGRHPVVEKITTTGHFVPNDTYLDHDQDLIHLITGPNMGGKSTYLRQVALICLMAQIGSFVPAEAAVLSVTDRIFTRVGASDNLARGQSTFMVEMQETANILNNATANSLIILDEIGRGTSTYDGVSIAWAILEYVHDVIAAKTLFATHYHELISVSNNLSKSKNYSVQVREAANEGVTFLYKIAEGGIDKSYGIEVAKLAGLPAWVVDRSKSILNNLEEGQVDRSIQKQMKKDRPDSAENQLNIFADSAQVAINQREQQALKKMENLDVNSLTPLQALQQLAEIKENLQAKQSTNGEN